jgi:peptidoglycan hydrolase CwlO-like protein
LRESTDELTPIDSLYDENERLRSEHANLKAQMDYSESVRTNLNQAYEQAQRENERLLVEVAEIRAREADEHRECDEREDNSTRIIGELRAENERLRARIKTLEARLDQILILANLE